LLGRKGGAVVTVSTEYSVSMTNGRISQNPRLDLVGSQRKAFFGPVPEDVIDGQELVLALSTEKTGSSKDFVASSTHCPVSLPERAGATGRADKASTGAVGVNAESVGSV